MASPICSRMVLAAFALLFVQLYLVSGGELTFELPDSEHMCFHEIIEKNEKVIFEYQVIQGGNYDVDVEISNPSGQSMYKEMKKQYDSYEFTTAEKGEYKVCFSNEFSTFTHKTVYFDWQVGDEDPIVPQGDHTGPVTQMTASAIAVHESLSVVIDYQTHHRLRETTGRSFAEELNERVMWWSVAEFGVVLLVGITQVVVLRSFFTDKKNRVVT